MSSQELLGAVGVHPGPVHGLRGQTVTWSTMEQDRQLLTETYRSYGFVDVEVGEPILEAVGDDAVRVVFPVVEGQRWVLTDLRIEGLPVESAGRLEQVDLGLSEAAPWNPRQVETTRRQLELILRTLLLRLQRRYLFEGGEPVQHAEVDVVGIGDRDVADAHLGVRQIGRNCCLLEGDRWPDPERVFERDGLLVVEPEVGATAELGSCKRRAAADRWRAAGARVAELERHVVILIDPDAGGVADRALEALTRAGKEAFPAILNAKTRNALERKA